MKARGDDGRQVELVLSNRTIVRALALVAAFGTLLYLVYLVREVLLLALISLFLALILNPAVTALQRRLGWKRQPAVLTVYLTVTVVVVGFVAAVLTPLIRELSHFLDHLPDYVDQLKRSQLVRDADQRYNILDRVRTSAERLSTEAPNVGNGLLGIAGKIVTAVIGAITIFFLTLFLLLELPRIAGSLHQLLPPERADRAERIALEVNTTVARYAAGALVIATIAGIVTWSTLTLLGVPFAIVLALLVAFFDLIPLVGATVGAILAVAVAFTHSTSAGITMLVVHLVYQQVENHVLQPMVARRSVDVSPVVVILSVLAGATLLGVLGALLAIPIAGSIQVALSETIDERRRRMAERRAALLASVADPPAAEPSG